MSGVRLCRICLAVEGAGIESELIPIFENNAEIAKQIYLCSGVKISDNDSSGSAALICAVCLKDLSKAMHFRNKAIRSEKYFRRSSEGWLQKEDMMSDEKFEPEVRIKLEDVEDIERVKSEPFDDDPNHELLANIDSMVGNHNSHLNSVPFVDVFSSNNDVKCERRKKSKNSDFEDFASSSGVVRCNLCLKTFTSVNSHHNHMKTVHREMSESEMHKCTYCNRFFKLKIYLNRHIARIHGTKTKSGKSGKRKCLNSISNKEDVSLYCELCKQFFTTRGSLQKHVRVKHEFVDAKDRFVCDHCGSTFLIKYYLIRHIRVRHLRNFVEKKTPDQPTPCEVCGKILKNRGLLKPHMRSHKIMTADDYWYCDLCPRKFKTKGGCTWHIQQRHILKATFPCKLCPNVVYKGKWELKCHIKSKHTNERDFKCERCGKGFMDKQKLQIHTRIHTGERPHACHICPQTFIHQTDLRRHIWGHTGERPYKCSHDHCGKGFMKRSELINHGKRCHPPVTIPQPLPYHHYAM